jgi:8-oxo-dGTP pyrophosphatase MutT (NUDIX family)
MKSFASFDKRIINSIQKFCLANNPVIIHRAIPTNLHLPDLPINKERKKASVLIPLCNRNGIPSILFTLRSSKVGTHKGQVSFPGGHLDIDESYENAAIRETYEELGDNIGKIKIIGSLQTVYSQTGTLVTPILGFLENDVDSLQHFNPNVDEVDRIFTRSIETLDDKNYISSEILKRNDNDHKIKMPVYGSNDGDERIWGLTAMLLHGALKHTIIPFLK